MNEEILNQLRVEHLNDEESNLIKEFGFNFSEIF